MTFLEKQPAIYMSLERLKAIIADELGMDVEKIYIKDIQTQICGWGLYDAEYKFDGLKITVKE